MLRKSNEEQQTLEPEVLHKLKAAEALKEKNLVIHSHRLQVIIK
jgi:hypothetical protein